MHMTETTEKITEIEQLLLAKNPQWSQDKARWMAKQALGLVVRRS